MQVELNKIYNMDCLEFMKQVPDKYFDLVVTDCPYKVVAAGVSIKNGVVTSDGTDCSNKWLKKNPKHIPSAMKNGSMFEHNDIKFHQWLPELYRILKNGTHCYIMINGRNLSELQNEATKAGFEFQNLLVWDKHNRTPNKYYMQQVEFILMLSKRPARNINCMGSSNLIDIPNAIGNKLHPTEKPVSLMAHLIENSICEDGIVYEPFAGSGSTCVACESLGIKWVATEINSDYVAIANKRLESVQGSLF